jgi:hypothetical protein
MPTSAISEEGVDMVLSPGDILKELERISKQPNIIKLPKAKEKEEASANADAEMNYRVPSFERHNGNISK